MKKIIHVAGILGLGVCGAAHAQPMPPSDPWGDATVSRADAESKAGERFDALDANHDGALSAEEIAAAAPAGAGARGQGGGMRRADADGDGKVTRAEFLAVQLRRFDMQDENKDGKLTKEEREAAMARMMLRMQQGGGGSGSGQ